MFMATRFNILCIDNEDSFLEEIQAALLRAGHQVHTAIGGANGLMLLGELPGVDVILINHILDDMPSMSVVQAVARRSTFNSTGVILHSAGDVFDLPVDHAAWQRVDVCLPAPFHPAELYDAVFEAYTRRRGYLYCLAP